MGFRNNTLSVERISGEYVKGLWTPDDSSFFNIKASVQPVNGREMLLLPENRRNVQTHKLYTSTQLRTSGSDIINADRVTINGSVFEVMKVDSWGNGIMEHFKVLVSLVEAVEMPS